MPFVFGDAFELRTPGERDLSKAMGCYWRSFAHTGHPTPTPGAAPCAGAGGGAWPRFTAGGEETMVLDVGEIGPVARLGAET